MKLTRIRLKGGEHPALVDSDGAPRSLAGIVDDITGAVLARPSITSLRQLDHSELPLINVPYSYGPCVHGPSKIVCVGLNYLDHAREAGLPVPDEPILFMKSSSAICGPNDNVIIPRDARKVDWEVELGVVIGERCSYVSEQEAANHIAGYCIVNDISDRAMQLEGTGQWVKGKSADTFGPIGPWLVTADEISDIHSLDIWLSVNGEIAQRSNTSQMIFSVYQLISYISRFMTLIPGDIISTGTPSGVGMGHQPQRYLRPGDVMRLGIDGLGTQTQRVVSWQAHEATN